MAEVPIAALKALARELDSLNTKYVFTGGSIIGLLVDAPGATVMRTEKRVYRPVEKIKVEFRNLPAERADEWITIVPFDANAGTFRQWKYTGKAADGTMEFMGLTRGSYEVRYHSSFGDKVVRSRYLFTVE